LTFILERDPLIRPTTVGGKGELMKQPGLDKRHRDEDGEIQRKRGDTQNQNLDKPIRGFSPTTTLKEMREKTGKESEEAVRRAAAKLFPK
jgi:hypothetical protein